MSLKWLLLVTSRFLLLFVNENDCSFTRTSSHRFHRKCNFTLYRLSVICMKLDFQHQSCHRTQTEGFLILLKTLLFYISYKVVPTLFKLFFLCTVCTVVFRINLCSAWARTITYKWKWLLLISHFYGNLGYYDLMSVTGYHFMW